MKPLRDDREQLAINFWGHVKTRTTPELDIPLELVSAANRCLERLREELECESE